MKDLKFPSEEELANIPEKIKKMPCITISTFDYSDFDENHSPFEKPLVKRKDSQGISQAVVNKVKKFLKS